MLNAKIIFFLSVFISVLPLQRQAQAAWPRHLSVCAGYLTSIFTASSEQSLKEALHSLHRFRFDYLRQAAAEPAIHNLNIHETIPDENYGSAGTVLEDEERAAQQIRGIEIQGRAQIQGVRPNFDMDKRRAQPTEEGPRSTVKVSALKIKGQEEIEKFTSELRDLVGDIENTGDHARIHELVHFMFGGAGLLVLGDVALPQMIHLVHGDPVSGYLLPGVAGAFLLGPDAMVRVLAARDFGFDRQMRRLTRNRNQRDWVFESRSYEVHHGIVDGIAQEGQVPTGDVRATVHLDAQPYWNLLLSRQLAKLKMKLDSTSLEGRDAFENLTRKVWVHVDRARFYEDGEPVLVVVVRTSRERPQF